VISVWFRGSPRIRPEDVRNVAFTPHPLKVWGDAQLLRDHSETRNRLSQHPSPFVRLRDLLGLAISGTCMREKAKEGGISDTTPMTISGATAFPASGAGAPVVGSCCRSLDRLASLLSRIGTALGIVIKAFALFARFRPEAGNRGGRKRWRPRPHTTTGYLVTIPALVATQQIPMAEGRTGATASTA
jgi:hypothetical protein